MVTLVTNDQHSLGLLQWALVIAEKAFEEFWKSLGRGRSCLPVHTCFLRMLLETTRLEGPQEI